MHRTRPGQAPYPPRRDAADRARRRLSSLVDTEEPLHRRYAHATHHTYTSIGGLDGQMVSANAYTFPVWLKEMSGLGQYLYEFPLLFRNAMGRFSDELRHRLPEPDPGIIRTNLEVLWVVVRRSLGLDTRAPSIRQGVSMLPRQVT